MLRRGPQECNNAMQSPHGTIHKGQMKLLTRLLFLATQKAVMKKKDVNHAKRGRFCCSINDQQHILDMWTS